MMMVSYIELIHDAAPNEDIERILITMSQSSPANFC